MLRKGQSSTVLGPCQTGRLILTAPTVRRWNCRTGGERRLGFCLQICTKRMENTKQKMGKKKAVSMQEIDDDRFSHAQHDPRFQRLPVKRRKLAVDERFKAMFDDDRFKMNYVVDKYGRKIETQSSAEDLKRFYRLEKEDKDQDEKSGSEGSQGSEDEQERERKRLEMASHVGFEHSDSSEEDDDDEGLAASEEEQDADDSVEEDIPMGEETHRLAIVNLDWDRMRAEDIFVILQSFVPEGGAISRVDVYPSDFGLERMELERVQGPVSVFTSKDSGSESDDSQNEEIDKEKLRRYEKERLKYFYAIATFDSSRTGAEVYAACDGTEFERSSNVIDLRFVPDEFQIDRKPRDSCTSVPHDYEAPDFFTKALQHSNVELSWDLEDPSRKRFFNRRMTPEEMERMDFSAYLASEPECSDAEGSDAVVEVADSGDEEGTAVLKKKARNRFSSLLEGINELEDGKEMKDDIVISFEPGLHKIGETILEKKAEKEQREGESVWEASQRRLREKRKERRRKRELAGEDAENDAMFDDPFFKDNEFPDDETRTEARPPQSKQSKPKAAKKTATEVEEEKRQRKELELLMMDDRQGDEMDDNKNGYNLKELITSHEEKTKGKRKKKKKNKKDGVADDEEERVRSDDFVLDKYDRRFQALYDDARFAVDPTHPEFKNTSAMADLLEERQRRRQLSQRNSEMAVKKRKELYASSSAAKDQSNSEKIRDSDLHSLVQKFKNHKHK